jgi:hypothetical protein
MEVHVQVEHAVLHDIQLLVEAYAFAHQHVAPHERLPYRAERRVVERALDELFLHELP